MSAALAGKAESLCRADAHWLNEGIACDIYCARPPERQSIAALIDGAPVDFAVQKTAGRRKTLLAADMDSTIIHEETLDILARFAGKEKEVAAITARAMEGKMDFAAALRARMELVSGLGESDMAAALAKITPRGGGAILTATMQANGGQTLLLSGGFEYFVAPIARRLGFGGFRCNRLVFADGKISGEIVPPILGPQDKQRLMLTFAQENGISADAILAAGDGANDAAMLQTAGCGVALHGKAAAKAAADIVIDYGDLTALLYLQGYSRDMFVIPPAAEE